MHAKITGFTVFEDTETDPCWTKSGRQWQCK